MALEVIDSLLKQQLVAFHGAFHDSILGSWLADKLAAAAILLFRGIRGKISSRVNQFMPVALTYALKESKKRP
jgi:hypothetical protein